MAKDFQIIVVGADCHNDWAKDVYLTFRDIGVDVEVVYTNTVIGGLDSSSNVATRALLENFKHFFRLYARSFFNFVKEVRRQMSERALLRKIGSFWKPGKKLVVIFIWTPLGVKLTQSIRKMDGVTLVLWQGEAPTRGPQWAPTFPYFDHIFYVDEDWLPLFAPDIQKKASFLPLSSSSLKFFPLKEGEQDKKFVSDIAFVGYYLKERAEALSILKDRDLKIYGYWWDSGAGDYPWIKEKYCGPLSNEDANRVFNGGKIQIGRLPSKVAYGDTITQRVFDISLAGNFQLSAYSPAIKKIFGDAVVMFHDSAELKKLIDYYLAHPDERRRLAAKAHDITLCDHTYHSRVKAILATLGIS
jgi:spore maturation protein CgeB